MIKNTVKSFLNTVMLFELHIKECCDYVIEFGHGKYGSINTVYFEVKHGDKILTSAVDLRDWFNIVWSVEPPNKRKRVFKFRNIYNVLFRMAKIPKVKLEFTIWNDLLEIKKSEGIFKNDNIEIYNFVAINKE